MISLSEELVQISEQGAAAVLATVVEVEPGVRVEPGAKCLVGDGKVSGETISDAGCCFRAFRRECIANIKFFKGAHRFLPTLIKMEGFTVAEIPIAHNPRAAGQSHYGVWNRLFKSSADLLAVRWMKKRVIRYKIAEEIGP